MGSKSKCVVPSWSSLSSFVGFLVVPDWRPHTGTHPRDVHELAAAAR